tara:strand:+ start:1089 stop:1457 length:369 start_codon:yes stop_codon:yes gene_type:complete
MNKESDKDYKTISEVAKLLNLYNSKTGYLSTHTLRYWEKEFKQVRPKIFAGKRRYYDLETIDILRRIKYLLKDKGMTINGAKKHLNLNNSDLDELSNTSINRKKFLKSKIVKISKILKKLKK